MPTAREINDALRKSPSYRAPTKILILQYLTDKRDWYNDFRNAGMNSLRH